MKTVEELRNESIFTLRKQAEEMNNAADKQEGLQFRARLRKAFEENPDIQKVSLELVNEYDDEGSFYDYAHLEFESGACAYDKYSLGLEDFSTKAIEHGFDREETLKREQILKF